MKALLIVGFLVAALFVVQSATQPEVVVMATLTPTPTATPEPSPSPTATATPVPTPTAKATPKPNTRVAYVQQQLVGKGYEPTTVNGLFVDERLKLYTIQTVAYKDPDWSLVEQRIYNDAYVLKGKNYVQANLQAFEAMERDYGIPKEVIAGLIATETDFGDKAGTTVTFNALYSRMRQWPEDKWQGQAAQLIALSQYCLDAKLDCFAIKGSYAGAIGIVQFMPNNLKPYGIDADTNGVVDLFNPVDAIPSAANFLIQHGWRDDQTKALGRYYGSSIGYPQIVLHYASLLKQ